MLTLTHCPVQAPGVISRQVEDEAVIVLPVKGEVKVINDVGAYIWALSNGERPIGEIIAAVCAQYQVETEQAQADVLAFIESLVERGALILLPAPKMPEISGV